MRWRYLILLPIVGLAALLSATPASAQTPPPLGVLQQFAILADAVVSTAGTTTVTNGDVGSNTDITGPFVFLDPDFEERLPPDDAALLTLAHDAATTASADLLDQAYGNIILAELGGVTLTPDVYEFSSTANIADPNTLTLDAEGDPNAVWVFLVGSSLTANTNSNVEFLDGIGNPCNVFWRVTASATLNGDTFLGTVIAHEGSVTLGSGVNLTGRAVSRTGAVTNEAPDTTVGGCSSALPDQDDDEIPDEGDNCPSVANPGQEDTDGDGIGDACDAEAIPDLIISKVCPSGGGNADFNILVTQLETLVDSDALDCGEVMPIADLEPGSYTIRELITGPDAGNFVTAIICTNADGQIVTPGSIATVVLELNSDTQCAVINVFDEAGGGPGGGPGGGGEPAPPAPPVVIIVPIDIDNTNTNALNNNNVNDNNNQNTNSQEQANQQTQTNDNNQTTTVNSSPSVRITGAPSAARPATVVQAPIAVSPAIITPPSTGSGGLLP